MSEGVRLGHLSNYREADLLIGIKGVYNSSVSGVICSFADILVEKYTI